MTELITTCTGRYLGHEIVNEGSSHYLKIGMHAYRRATATILRSWHLLWRSILTGTCSICPGNLLDRQGDG